MGVLIIFLSFIVIHAKDGMSFCVGRPFKYGCLNLDSYMHIDIVKQKSFRCLYTGLGSYVWAPYFETCDFIFFYKVVLNKETSSYQTALHALLTQE